MPIYGLTPFPLSLTDTFLLEDPGVKGNARAVVGVVRLIRQAQQRLHSDRGIVTYLLITGFGLAAINPDKRGSWRKSGPSSLFPLLHFSGDKRTGRMNVLSKRPVCS